MQGPSIPNDGKVSYRDLKIPDGARSIVSELGEDLWSIGGSTYLILPSDRLVREVVRSRSAGTGDRVITVKRLPGHLYDLFVGTSAVRDDLFREAAVARIMESPDIVRLRPEGGGTRGMARHVAEVIKELLVNCRSPLDLTRTASTGRSRELSEIYTGYMALLRSTGSVDVEELPSMVADLIDKDPIRISGLSFGIYMPGKLDLSYSRMLSAILRSCLRANVAEHEVRGPPEFMGGGYARTETNSIPAPGSRSRETVRWPEPVQAIYGEDRITSLRAVCRHIKHLVKDDGVAPEEIAIVTPGGSLHERYLPTILTEFGIPYSMDREVHASEVPAVSGMIGLLSLPSDDWRSIMLAEHLTAVSGKFAPEGGEGVTGPELSIAFTEVPVFGGPDPEEGWIMPMRRYLEEGGRSERTRSICERAIPALEALMGRIKEISALRTDPRRFASEVRSFISFVQRSVTAPEASDVRDESLVKLDRAAARVPAICPDLNAMMDLSYFLDMLNMCLAKDKVELAENGGGVWAGKIKQQAGRRSKVVILHSMTDTEYPQRSPDFRLLTGGERSALSMREPTEGRHWRIWRSALAPARSR
jgi:hypothetical protein